MSQRSPHKFTLDRRIARVVLTTIALTTLVAPGLPAVQGQTGAALEPPDLGCPATPGCFSLDITVCGAGPNGAPAGFTIQWQTASDFETFGWPDAGDTPATSFCRAEFLGSQFQLGPDECVVITFGSGSFPSGVSSACSNSALQPDTEYVFRAYAIRTTEIARSPWSDNLNCSTAADCPPEGPGTGGEDGCTFGVGYWKNHGPGSSQGNEWPIDSITLGSVTYTDEEAMQILREPTRGNGLVALARQLIAAKLNIANGASSTDIADAIAEADALIGDLEVPPIGDGFLSPSETGDLVDALTAFNEGDTGPGHCDDE